LKTIIFTFFLILTVEFAKAQIKNEAEMYRNLFQPEIEHVHYAFSEQVTFLGNLFVFYKKYISSQDSGHCMFYPSCSEYAVQTIKKHGIIGFFDAFDRLARCNTYGKNQYKPYKNTSLKLDLPN